MIFKISIFLHTFLALGQFLQAQDTIPSVKIGEQVWLSKNLDVVTFRNGDTIPEAKSDSAWIKAGEESKPAWCYYNNDTENGKKYGKLYNWYAVNDSRGLAPEGWRIPMLDDWIKLSNKLGKKHLGEKLKTSLDWKGLKGTNIVGFSALPAGQRWYDGSFEMLYEFAHWFCYSDVKREPSEFSLAHHSNSFHSDRAIERIGLSVRCVRD